MNKIQLADIKHRAENGQATSQDCLDLLEAFEVDLVDELEDKIEGLEKEKSEYRDCVERAISVLEGDY